MALIHITIEKLILEVREPIDAESKTILNKILKNTDMANDTLQELKDLAAESSTRLDNIAGDITRILDSQVPQEGGLTADEVADLRSTLTALRDKAKGLDEQNEPSQEPPVEPA